MEIKIYAIKLKLMLGLGALLLLISACSKQSSDAALINKPVVQAYLIAGQIVTVKLYKQKAVTDTTQYGAAITGQKVYISDGSTNVLLTESKAGVYTYNDVAFLTAGKTYTLQFSYLGYNVTAQTVMPSKPTGLAIRDSFIYISSSILTPNHVTDTLDKITWNNPSLANDIIVFNNLTGRELPLTNYRAGTTNGSLEVNTDQASYYFITQTTLPYFAYYQVMLYRVNDEYIDFIKSNTNSATSQTLINAYTNITNGYGIFTAMQLDADLVYLRVYSS